MEAITRKVVEIGKEQKRAERLLGKLLPKNVALALKNGQVHFIDAVLKLGNEYILYSTVVSFWSFPVQKISESFDAATVMFCTISGFKDLTKERTPIEVKEIQDLLL